MKTYFHVDILTPYGKYLSTEADYLSVTSGLGVLGILPNHAPLVTTLEISKLVIKCDNRENNYAIGGGIMHIKEGNQIVLLLNSIESPEEIDLKRAEEAKDRAEKRLLEKNNIDVVRAKTALSKALNRISVYELK